MKFNSITLNFSDDLDKKCVEYIMERYWGIEGKRPFVSDVLGVEICLETLHTWQDMLANVKNDGGNVPEHIKCRLPRVWSELQSTVVWVQSKLNRPKVQRFSL